MIDAPALAADGSSEYSGGWRNEQRHGYGVLHQVGIRLMLPLLWHGSCDAAMGCFCCAWHAVLESRDRRVTVRLFLLQHSAFLLHLRLQACMPTARLLVACIAFCLAAQHIQACGKLVTHLSTNHPLPPPCAAQYIQICGQLITYFQPPAHPLPRVQRNMFKYAGQWEADLQSGEGKCQYADGSQYDGQWKAGQR